MTGQHFMALGLALGLIFYLSSVSAEISQTSAPGKTARMTFAAGLYGQEYECGVLKANGHLVEYNITMEFSNNGDSEAWANDMFLLIKNNLTYPSNDFVCYQYGGYDYNVPGCAIVGYWPHEWENEYQVSGTADMTDAELTIGENTPYQWEICIGNGWRECPQEVGYVGNVTVNNLETNGEPPTPVQQPTDAPFAFEPTLYPASQPVSQPTMKPTESGETNAPTSEKVIIEERCGLDAIVQFDTELKGGKKEYDYFPGDGSLTGINVSMYFGGATFNSAEWASDMELVVKMLDNSSCIIVGGFDYNIPGCDFLQYWPSNWQTSEAGVYTYFIELDDDHGLTGNNSYAVAIANGYKYGENPVYYNGDITLVGIKYDCYFPPDTYMVQASTSGEEGRLKFEGQFSGTDEVCGVIQLQYDPNNPMSTKVQNIVMNPLTFNANGYPGTWASDMFVTITDPGGSTQQKCVQVGGYDYHSPGCTQYGYWPSSWEESDKDGGTDTEPSDFDNSVEAEEGKPGGGDVSTADLVPSLSYLDVCIGNGWREDGGIAFYTGEIVLKGTKTSTLSVAPTPVPSGTRASPTPLPTKEPGMPPTKEPTAPPTGDRVDFAMDSYYLQTASVEFDIFESGGNNQTYFFLADGYLHNISITFTFGGSPDNSGEWASDMQMVIEAPNGGCVQIGGFDYYLPNCDYEDKWPETWDTSVPGTYTHTSIIDKSVLTGNGDWSVSIVNGYVYGTQSVTYQGMFQLNGVVDGNPNDVPPPPPAADDDTPVTETAAFIVPITLLVIGIVGGAIFYAYYNWAVSNGKWKAWGSGGGSSWRSRDVKPALTSSILSEGTGPGAYVPPTVSGSAVVNPIRNKGGPMSRDERL